MRRWVAERQDKGVLNKDGTRTATCRRDARDAVGTEKIGRSSCRSARGAGCRAGDGVECRSTAVVDGAIRYNVSRVRLSECEWQRRNDPVAIGVHQLPLIGLDKSLTHSQQS